MLNRRRFVILAGALAGAVALWPGQATRTSAQTDPMLQALAQLSGDAFDQAFLGMMIPHHAMAVLMARPAAANASHPELREFASAIATNQTAEIAQMQGWLTNWYGITVPDPLAVTSAMPGMSAGTM